MMIMVAAVAASFSKDYAFKKLFLNVLIINVIKTQLRQENIHMEG